MQLHLIYLIARYVPMHKPYDLIIFDWDGTLVDSQAQIISCIREAFAKVGLTPPDPAAARHIIGLSLEAAASRLAPQADRTMIDALANTYRELALANSDRSTQLFEGVESGLRTLRQQGLYLAVATGKGRRGLEQALNGTELADVFDITRCADETCSKPHPMMLDEILTDLNMDPERAVMVGDTSYDIEMANNIGMDSIAVTYGMHEEIHLRPLKPKYLINHFSEIQSCLVET
jgi:phosphoglycolate phosphatase